MKQLTANTYYIPCNHATDRPAIGVVVGKECVLVVDSGNSPAHAGEIRAAVRRITDLPIQYLCITHWHWDHTFGMSAFVDSTIIAHPETNQKLQRLKSYTWDDEALDERVRRGAEIPFCADNIKKEYPDRSHIVITTADITTKDLSLDLGGVHVHFFAVGGEHSIDSCCVYVQEDEVLFLGDSLCHNMFTGPWSYHLPEFERRLSKISSIPCKWYVNSHWDPENEMQFAAYCKNMRMVGGAMSDIYDEALAIPAFERLFGHAPDAEQLDLAISFIRGNVKANKR